MQGIIITEWGNSPYIQMHIVLCVILDKDKSSQGKTGIKNNWSVFYSFL